MTLIDVLFSTAAFLGLLWLIGRIWLYFLRRRGAECLCGEPGSHTHAARRARTIFGRNTIDVDMAPSPIVCFCRHGDDGRHTRETIKGFGVMITCPYAPSDRIFSADPRYLRRHI